MLTSIVIVRVSIGPPGTGKTMLAKAVAAECGANFLNVTQGDLRSKWWGEAEQLTQKVFKAAVELAPTVIFVDEIDALLCTNTEYNRNLTMEFLASWDGLLSSSSRVMVMGATNRPQQLDEALLRRLPRRLLVDLPSFAERRRVLEVVLKDECLSPDFTVDAVATLTDGYSGSDIANLCAAAAYRPLRELLEDEAREGIMKKTMRDLTLNDFEQAKKQISASVAKNSTASKVLQRWHAQYGDGGTRQVSSLGF